MYSVSKRRRYVIMDVVCVEDEGSSGGVLRVYIATRFLLGVVVGTFIVGRAVGARYGAYTGAYNKLVPYRSLLGIDED